MPNYSLDPYIKMNIEKIMENLEDYRPRRRGWTWRKPIFHQKLGSFTYSQTSAGLKASQPLPAAGFFGGIDPQPECTITSEIASGRFEDDLRRMRMAAPWLYGNCLLGIGCARR